MIRDDPMVGRALGEFQVRERIGEGGFGAVYRADQKGLAREAVIKVLQVHHRGRDQVVQRFSREALLASRLDHPYAAHLYAFGAEPDGLLWIAMELVRGVSLGELLAVQGKLPPERLVPFFERICEVVHSAHEQGIVHRDLKPANIMVVTRSGRMLPKLLDFGIAKVIGDVIGGPREEVTQPIALGRDDTVEAAMTQNQLVGSPRYMAPEQWADSGAVGAQADIYALGAVGYECLTGRPAFAGASADELFDAHLLGPIPSLGAGLPRALDGVIGRALAKRPADRYQSALELAEALRAAAGMAADPAALPRLDPAVREAMVAGAPEPIADAIAAFDTAHNAHQARDALWRVVRVAVRYLGVLALACRTRVGAAAGLDREPVAGLLRGLRRSGLGDDEWWRLGRELCRPFAARPDTHPMPELVGLYFAATDRDGRAVGLVAALRAHREAGEQSIDGSESVVRRRLEPALAALAELCGELAFLSAYRLVVFRAGRADSWMGARRAERTAALLPGRPLADGQVALVDADGSPVVALSPLVQAAAPAPGEPDELFLVDGDGRHGARLVAPRHGFERHDPAVWTWLEAHLPADASAGEGAGSERPPYRGLAAFTAGDADLFVGREREIEAFANRLRRQPLLAVVGPSGAGKSSFVQAGVVPALPAGWRAVIMRPGPAPLASLGSVLERAGLAGGAEVDAGDPAGLGRRLRAAAGPDGAVVLVVDQFEELFTLCRDAGERERFARLLAGLARAADDPVRVVLTLRDDFLMRAESLPELRERLATGLQLLGTPAPAELARILEEPARRAGYELEGTLARDMVGELDGVPGALALLSFTAAALWELRDRHFRRLPRAAYEAIGGVGGALARHAEETLERMPPEQRGLVRTAFGRLVTSDGTRAALTRGELVGVLGGGAQAGAVVEALIAARLLTASEAEGGDDRVEVIHEALLAAWPRLVDWRRDEAEGARLREQLGEAARQWDGRGRPRGLLWRGDALAEYQRWRARYPGALTPTEQAFAAAGLAEAARGRRVRRLLVGTAFAVLAAGMVVLVGLNRRAEQQRRRALANLVELYEEQGRTALLRGDSLRALLYLDEAYRLGSRGPAMQFLLGRATAPIDAELLALRGHTAKLFSARFSPDGRRIVTAGDDATARVWDAASGRSELVLVGHTAGVVSAVFSPAGDRIVTASLDDTAKIWDSRSGTLLASLPGWGKGVQSASFDSSGRRVVTAGGSARIWDAATGAPLVDLDDAADDTWYAEFSPDGRRVLTAGFDGIARVWDADAGRPLAVLVGHTGGLVAARISSDGRRVLTGSLDETARLWDADSGALIAVLRGHTGAVTNVAFSADGVRLVTGSRDQTARVWDGATGALVATLRGHTGYVNAAAFLAGGARLATASADGSARVWDAATGNLLTTLEGHAGVVFALAVDGRGRLLTAGWDKTARVWDPTPRHLVASIESPGGKLTAAALDPHGDQIATGSADGVVRLWDARTGSFAQALPDHVGAVTSVRFAGSDLLLSAGADGTARLWDRVRAAPLQILRHEGPVGFAVPSPDGELAITGPVDGAAWVWTSRSGARLAELRDPQRVRGVAAFSPDGGRFALLEGNEVALWSTRPLQRARTLTGHDGSVRSADFSADGRLLATGSVDRTARVWDVATGAAVAVLAGHDGGLLSVELSPDGTTLAAATEDTSAYLWDVASGTLRFRLEGHSGHILTASFSPDGELIVTASGDKTAKIWDVRGGRLLASLEGHAAELSSAQFSPDGSRVMTVAADRVNLWDVSANARSAAELDQLVRCRLPIRLVDGRIAAADPTACHGD